MGNPPSTPGHAETQRSSHLILVEKISSFSLKVVYVYRLDHIRVIPANKQIKLSEKFVPGFVSDITN